MNKTDVKILLGSVSIFAFVTAAFAAQQTLTTYYPSPAGSYQSLRTNSLSVDGQVAIGTSTPNTIWADNLQVRGDGGLEIVSTNDGTSYIDFKGNTHTANNYWGRINYLDGSGFSFFQEGSGTAALNLAAAGDLSTTDGSIIANDSNNGYASLVPLDGGIELGSGNDATSYIDFKGSANLGGDFRGRFLYTDGTGFAAHVAAGATAKMMLSEAGAMYLGGANAWNLGLMLHVFDLGGGAYQGVIAMRAGAGTAADDIWIGPNTGSQLGSVTLSAQDVQLLGSNTICVGASACNTPAWWAALSDERLKKDVTPIEQALEKVNNMTGVYFNYIESEEHGITAEEASRRQVGLIAQEVEKVVPEVIMTNPDGIKRVDYNKLTALLIEAVKEQQKQIEQLKAAVAELKGQKP